MLAKVNYSSEYSFSMNIINVIRYMISLSAAVEKCDLMATTPPSKYRRGQRAVQIIWLKQYKWPNAE